MRAALRLVVLVFGAGCALIALAHIALGTRAIPGQVFVNPTLDSEDRFYAAFFLAFGVALIWCSLDLLKRGGAFRVLLVPFFIGGIARVISAALVRLPDPLFVALTAVELILPPLLWWWHHRTLSTSLPLR
jgi:hypothetical protein